jgi:hypothetical protein
LILANSAQRHKQGILLKTVFRTHPVLSTAFLLISALALFFAVSTVINLIYWSSRAREAVAPWMTVGYIGHSWDLDPRNIDARAGLPLPGDHPYTLTEIAQQRGVPVSEIVALVEATVAAMIAEREAGQ